MQIRKATQNDYPALLAIGHKFFAFNPYRHYSSLDEMSLLRTFHQLTSDHILLIAEEDIQIIGTAAAFIAPTFWNHNDLQGLEAFWWVDEAHRGDGTGEALRAVLQEIAKDKGVKFWNMIALKESMHDAVCAKYIRAGMDHIETVYMKVL